MFYCRRVLATSKPTPADTRSSALADSLPMILYCVRHGQSVFNAEGRIQGQFDVPLSELGRQQAEAVAHAMASKPIDAVFASPLSRAMETARPVAEKLDLHIQTDDRLMEINVSIFQKCNRRELEERYPDEFSRWKAGDPDYAPPGGESRRQLMIRGRDAFEHILASGHQHIAVIAHGGLIGAAFKSFLEIPARLHPFRLENGSISRLAYEGEDCTLLSLNEVEHLRHIGLAGMGDL